MSKRRNVFNEGIMSDTYSDAKNLAKDIKTGFKDFLDDLEKTDKNSANLLTKLMESNSTGDFIRNYVAFYRSYINANKGYFDQATANKYLQDNPRELTSISSVIPVTQDIISKAQKTIINPNSKGQLREIEVNLAQVFINLLNSSSTTSTASSSSTSAPLTSSGVTESKQDRMLTERWKKMAGII